MTTLILVRHGQSTGNLMGVYCGQIDFPLSDLGFAQAEQTGKYIKENYSIDTVYASDLKRAIQTAEPTARAFGLETIPDADLREICVGEWQGQNADLIFRTRAEEMLRWRTDSSYAPKGGESFGELRIRINRFLDRVLEANRDQTVAVFAHAGTIGTILARCIPNREERLALVKNGEFENASVTVLRFCGRDYVDYLLVGYEGHLMELSSHTDGTVV